jgi:hypothetical protein
MHSLSNGSQSKIAASSLALMLATLWLLVRGYQGLTGDAQIYAFQALARIHSQFAADLYLQNTSQDRFTMFSPLYAWCIGWLGLEQAARLLTVLFTVWLLAAAWSLARAISGRDAAWLATACLLIVAGDYGGAGVFRLLEPYLTARLPAEAMIVSALACHVRGTQRLGLALAIAALFVHPLMALPGCLLLICLWLPLRVDVMGAIAGVLAALGMAVAAAALPAAAQAVTIMDPPWLKVVQERSQFLFLQLWSVHDWELNARPFIYLGFTAIVIQDMSVRKLCAAAALVGAAGLAVALIGGVIGPMAILVQGQAWRWVWIAVFMGALLLPATALAVWRDPTCGPLCALLMLCGWSVSALGTVCLSLALALWVLRPNLGAGAPRYCRCAAVALGAGIVAWVATEIWGIVSHRALPPGHLASGAAHLRDIFGSRAPAALGAALLWWGIRASRVNWVPIAVCIALLAMSVLILPAAFRQARNVGSAADRDEFADWANAIPPTATVLVAPARDVGGFVWFTLLRPNYLAVDQSAGVVFSRATALEILRRSQVLLPLMDPNWKILTSLRNGAASGKRKPDAASRPLTARTLIEVCTDAQLGFVISPENVGFDPLRHERAGAWKDWNLYDCRQVRSAFGAT